LKFSEGTLQFLVFLAERVKRVRFIYERARKRLASRLRVYSLAIAIFEICSFFFI